MMVLEIELQHAESIHPRAESDSRIYAAISERTIIGPVLQVHIIQFLGTYGIEIQIPSTTTEERNSWAASWMSYLTEIQDTIPRVMNYFWKDLLQRKANLVLQSWSNRGISCDAVYISDESSVLFKRCYSCWRKELEWHSCLRIFQRSLSLSAEISKLVMRLVRHYDQDERETDGAVHWNSMVPKLRKAFQKSGGRKFQYCMNSPNSLLKNRAIQGHTGENLIASELMGHVAIQYERKEFLFHRGCSYDVASILIAGGRESKEGRQTIFCTPLNPFGYIPDEEEPSDDLSKPRKVHYHSKSKKTQDAVCWVD